MNWTDEELDSLFKEAAQEQKFEYKPEYWNDIEMQLPVKRSRKPLFWWFTASLFVVAYIGLLINPAYKVDSPSSALEENANLEMAGSNQVIENSFDQSQQQNPSKNDKVVVDKTITPQSDLLVSNKKIKTDRNTFVSSTIENTENNSTEIINDDAIVEGKDTEILSPENTLSVNEENLPLIEENVSEFMPVLTPNSLSILETPEGTLEAGKTYGLGERRNKMFVELSAGVGQSWTQTDENLTNVNGIFSASAAWIFPIRKFSLSTGIGFTYTKFTDLKIQERTKIYSFGSQMMENNYQFNSMSSFLIPVSISYGFGRHSIGLGLTGNWNLITGVSKVQLIDEKQTVYSRGFSDVSLFNRFGLNTNISYDYYVNENIQIGLRYGVQLIQPVQSERFIGTAQKMPFESQFYIRRTLNF